MRVEIIPLGGLGEVGKNMTALGFNGRYVIVDMGIRLDSILAFEDADIGGMSREELISISGIPDDGLLRNRRVIAIALTHGHLDHIGALCKLGHAYDAPIFGTPFTIELARRMIREERTAEPKGELKVVEPGDKVALGDVELEFIPVTHSIPHTVLLVAHGSQGSILYASDFKLDDEPLLGYKTDLSRLKQLGREGLLAAMIGAVRVDEPGPTPAEARAREMLREVMGKANSGEAILVTTFSSHIARLKSIVDLSFELGRTPVMVGRSLRNYSMAALELGLVDFPPELRIHGSPNSVHHVLREAGKSKKDYVLVCTGHQGEPTSVLSRIANGSLPFEIGERDEVIFSASVIPNPINESNRELLEAKLRVKGVRIHRDVHVSGHAGRRDTAEFIELVKPEHLVPCHGTFDKLELVAGLGRELGYSSGQLHLLRNGSCLKLGD